MKIIVYEDCLVDACRFGGNQRTREAGLCDHHDITIRYVGPNKKFENFSRGARRNGFTRGEICYGAGDPSTEQADLFIVDGLEGSCWGILGKIPQSATKFLCSGDEYILEKNRQGKRYPELARYLLVDKIAELTKELSQKA